MQSFILIDGLLQESTENCLTAGNRCFRYGDGIFETMRLRHGVVLWDEYHYRRLLKAAAMIKLEIPEPFSQASFSSSVCRLYWKNHPNGESARVRFSLFRKDGGYYTPTDNKASFLIESERLNTDSYNLNINGLHIDLYAKQRKAIDPFSNLKTSSALMFVMAALYKKEQQLDDCLIINEKGLVAEALSSNVFVVSGNKIMTPGLDQGCVEGVMRAVLMQLAAKSSIKIEERPLHPSLLLEADEVFVSNSINGVSWVKSFRKKEYTKQHVVIMHNLLNQALNEVYGF